MNRATKTDKQSDSQNGFTLLELMVAMVIGMVVIAAAISLFKTSIALNHSTSFKAQLQEESFFVSHVLKQQLAQIGYRPINDSKVIGRLMPIDDRVTSFPEVSNKWAAGQVVKFTATDLSYRFHGASADDTTADYSIYDCLGNPVAKGDVQTNKISIKDNQLICTVDDSTQVLLGADETVQIENIAYELGVDDNRDKIVDRIVDAESATTADFVNAKQLVLRMLLVTPDKVATSDQTYYFNETEFVSTDRKFRHESVVSMTIRN